jgi:uncharacterized membrane protein
MIDAFLHWFGSGLCHQLPARSFFAGGHLLPVCARDTGIYFGVVLSLGLIAALDRGRHSSSMPRPWVLALGAALFAFMAWDGVTSYAGWRTTTNDLRLITGLCAGFALSLVIAPLVNSQLWRRREDAPVLIGPLRVVVWLASIGVAFVGLRWGAPLLGIVYPIATVVAIFLTFTAINVVVVALAPRFERSADRLRDAWLPLLIAGAITFAEIAALAWLRSALLPMLLSR